MIAFPFSAGLTLVIVGWIIFRAAVCCKNKRIDWKRELIQLLFLVNLTVIYRFTFHPFGKVDGKIQPLIFEWATAWPFRVNLVPFVNLADYDIKREMLLNIIGNFAMFIPTGIMTPLIYKNLGSFKKVMLTGFLISLCIEILQLPFAVRASDVDDLILNTAGCLAGYGIFALIRWVKRRTPVIPKEK